jgi:hypothetical protein
MVLYTPAADIEGRANPQPHAVKEAKAAIIARLSAWTPATVVGEPDANDGRALNDDLQFIWSAVDPLVRAVGEYAQQTLGLSRATVERFFTDRVRGALEGEATYEITAAVNDRLARARDEEAEMVREFRSG